MDKRITYQELVDTFSDTSGMTKTQSDAFIKAFRDAVIAGLEKDRKVSVSGLGIFELLWVEEREGRNPQTGETIMVEAHNRILFKPTGSLKSRVNAAYEELTFEILPDEPIRSSSPTKLLDEDSKPEVSPTSEKLDEKVEAIQEDYIKDNSIVHSEEDELGSSSIENQVQENAEIENDEEQTPITPSLPAPTSAESFKSAQSTLKKPVSEKRTTNWLPVIIVGIVSIITLVIIISQAQMGNKPATAPPQIANVETQKTESSDAKETVVENDVKKETTPVLKENEPVFLAIHQSKKDEWFYSIARKYYGTERFWVFIYQANSNILGNPDTLLPNTTLRIPELSINLDLESDRIKLAKAYLSVYQGYSKNNQTKARKFLMQAHNVHPNGILKDHRLEIELSDAAWLSLFSKK